MFSHHISIKREGCLPASWVFVYVCVCERERERPLAFVASVFLFPVSNLNIVILK